MKTFENIVKDVIGRNVKLFFETVSGTPHSFEGKLLAINTKYFHIQDLFTKTDMYVNLGLNSLVSIEVYPE